MRRYRARMLEAAKSTKSPEQLALLQEELQSPCYEEVAVFQAFSRAVIAARKEFTVMDTARPGHFAAARHRGCVPSAVDPERAGGGADSYPAHDAAGRRLYENPHRRASGDDTGSRSERSRTTCGARVSSPMMGDQCQLGRRPAGRPFLRSRAAAEVRQIAKVKETLPVASHLFPFRRKSLLVQSASGAYHRVPPADPRVKSASSSVFVRLIKINGRSAEACILEGKTWPPGRTFGLVTLGPCFGKPEDPSCKPRTS